jgi:hypothetical protein
MNSNPSSSDFRLNFSPARQKSCIPNNSAIGIDGSGTADKNGPAINCFPIGGSLDHFTGLASSEITSNGFNSVL